MARDLLCQPGRPTRRWAWACTYRPADQFVRRPPLGGLRLFRLCVRQVQVLDRLPRARPGLHGVDHRNDRPEEQGEGQPGHQPGDGRVAADPLRQPPAGAGPPGRHRLPPQPPRQVVGQGPGRLVPPGRLLLQTL
jgi:hypothetical protein